ncbi:hypothetical protein Ahia01_000642600 [Argonauta hians]
MSRIPDRWTDYSNFGKVINRTRFVACKTPLKSSLTKKAGAELRFTPEDLVNSVSHIGLVIDLTLTSRYYDYRDLLCVEGIDYKKIATKGHQVPNREVVAEFFSTVDHFLSDPSKKDKVLVTHCTHGVNRTGYLLSLYMISKLGISPQDAIQDVGNARGHPIERQNYIDALLYGNSNHWQPGQHDGENYNYSNSMRSAPHHYRGGNQWRPCREGYPQRRGANWQDPYSDASDIQNFYRRMHDQPRIPREVSYQARNFQQEYHSQEWNPNRNYPQHTSYNAWHRDGGHGGGAPRTSYSEPDHYEPEPYRNRSNGWQRPRKQRGRGRWDNLH